MYIRTIIRKGFLSTVAAIVMAAPLATLANVSADQKSDTGCDIPAESTYGPGTHAPSGDDASAFVYQCPDSQNPNKPYVGKWVSAHYVYDPVKDKTSPLVPPTYTYNKTTGKYDYTKWVWEPESSSYKQVNASAVKPPAGANVIGGPDPVTPADPSGGGSTGSTPAATTNSVGTTGPGSTNTTSTDGTNNTTIDNATGVAVTNTIGSTATSGDAMVIANTHGGSATTGDAITQADVINMLQSSSNALGTGTNVTTFTYTIGGDVNGDLLFDPSLVQGPNSTTTNNNTLSNNLLINNTSDTTINNDLTLNANSGNAAVAANTYGGNATSGSATAVANIVNSIESSIVAGKSFIGTINITGNLNGDILLPADFVDQLIADNVPTTTVTAPNSTDTTNITTSNKSTVTNTNNQGITNTVTSTAQSGDAKVKGNTNAGAASSGNAATHVTAFNLTGSKVVASNDILVFVNVVGHWTGLIMNAPAGATAAEIGGNVTENDTVSNNATLNNTNNEHINNNVKVNAASGDATVKNNTNAGYAKTGDAETAVNLTNIEDSTLDLSNWFGILFINVFGTWNGSFGVNTSAGNVAAATGTSGTYLVGAASKLVHYAAPAATTTATPSAGSGTSSNTGSSNLSSGTVLAAHTTAPVHKAAPQLQTTTGHSLLLPAIGVVLSLSILGSERLFTRRRHA